MTTALSGSVGSRIVTVNSYSAGVVVVGAHGIEVPAQLAIPGTIAAMSSSSSRGRSSAQVFVVCSELIDYIEESIYEDCLER